MEKWFGKFAVVTGASCGIGEAIVRDFARNGINVIGLARRSEKVEEIAKNLKNEPGKVHARKCDISDPKSVEEAFKWIEDEFGIIHILVNNAAVCINSPLLDESHDVTNTINAVINTNFTGLVHCTRAAVKLMKKSDGYGMVININSHMGHSIPFSETVARMNVYAPTKFALTALSEVFRQELILQNNAKIRVSNLSPGNVKTEVLVAGGFVKDADEVYNHYVHLSAENVAQTVLFLLQTPHNVNITQLTIKPVGEQF